jgi:hypothetical protein
MGDNEVRRTFTGVRVAGDSRRTGSVRFEVSPGCVLTLFEDGRVRFRIDPQDGRKIVHWRNNSNKPGAQLLETKLA